MNHLLRLFASVLLLSACVTNGMASKEYRRLIKQHIYADYKKMYSFQNWNYLVLNMIAWIEGQLVIREF